MTLPFPFGFVFHSEAQVPAFVGRQWEFQGGFGPALDPKLWTPVLTYGWVTPMWKNPLIAVGLGWLPKEECCVMEIKRLWRVHPPLCLPRKTCCDFPPATFVVKLWTRRGLRVLFSLAVGKRLQTQSCAFAGKVSKGKSRRVFAFSLMGRNFFHRHCIISVISASLEERSIEYLTLEPLLSPDVCFAHK